MISSLPLTAFIILGAMVPGYAIGWGTLSLINAGLAQSKNHSGLAWWVISLLLGPIATLVIVVFLQKQEPFVKRYNPDF